MQSLKTIRRTKGITQKQISEKAGISQGSYSDIESGKKGMKPVTAIKVLGILGIDWIDYYKKKYEEEEYAEDIRN